MSNHFIKFSLIDIQALEELLKIETLMKELGVGTPEVRKYFIPDNEY